MKTKSQINLRPIANIARKYAPKSFQIGNFGMSEGYDINRLCFADQVAIQFHPATLGSAFRAINCTKSVAEGTSAIKKIAQDLLDAGYRVESTGSLELRVTITKSEETK